MKILLAPMAALAETAGPASRVRLLAEGFREAGIEVATCAAEDVNFREIEGIRNFFLDVPMPMGLPKVIATRTFPVAQKIGITARKTVTSFDQVLRFTGNLDYKYLRKSVESVRQAVQEFRPDAVYSEFNISAMIAARKEGLPLFATVSCPTQHTFACEPSLAKGLNRLLRELELPEVESALQLFDWADRAFCPSIRELEPMDREDVCYVGALKATTTGENGSGAEGMAQADGEASTAQDSGEDGRDEASATPAGVDGRGEASATAGTGESARGAAAGGSAGDGKAPRGKKRNKVLVYMGNGTVSAKQTMQVVSRVFCGSGYEVYFASSYLPEGTTLNVHVAPRWDFDTLLDEAVLFINHGGQNSIMDGLIHGVPQIMVPGKVFERQYNAKSVMENKAGVSLSYRNFNVDKLSVIIEKVAHSKKNRQNAAALGKKLMAGGGVKMVAQKCLLNGENL